MRQITKRLVIFHSSTSCTAEWPIYFLGGCGSWVRRGSERSAKFSIFQKRILIFRMSWGQTRHTSYAITCPAPSTWYAQSNLPIFAVSRRSWFRGDCVRWCSSAALYILIQWRNALLVLSIGVRVIWFGVGVKIAILQFSKSVPFKSKSFIQMLNVCSQNWLRFTCK